VVRSSAASDVYKRQGVGFFFYATKLLSVHRTGNCY
jgi:hypothetical protein